MKAMESGDVEAVMALLAEDADWSMPPLPAWFTGADALRNFMHNGPLSGEWRWRHHPAGERPAGRGQLCLVRARSGLPPVRDRRVHARGARIKSITSFINRSTLGATTSSTSATRAAGGRLERERAGRGASACPSCSPTDEFRRASGSLLTCSRAAKAFSGFAVDDVDKAREFYLDTLGIEVSERRTGIDLHIADDRPTLVYPGRTTRRGARSSTSRSTTSIRRSTI